MAHALIDSLAFHHQMPKGVLAFSEEIDSWLGT
jgi:hypothetical protein